MLLHIALSISLHLLFSPRVASLSNCNPLFLHFIGPLGEGISQYTVGFGWREAVYHSITAHKYLTSVPWLILSPAKTAKVIEKEGDDHKWLHHNWACGHCPEHLHRQGSKNSVVDHVKTIHEINDPEDPHDFFYFERFRMPLFNRMITILSTPESSVQA